MLAAALVRLLRDEDRRGLARLVGQNAELARRIVIEEVDVDITVLRLIGRCQDAARLRVALGADGIGNGTSKQGR